VASYRLLVKRSAAKEIDGIGQRRDRERVVAAIGALAEEPRPAGAEKLAGRDDRYRIRVGDYRVVYSIEDAALIVWIVKVGHRRDVYR
jgi:mRNA interferase RelE/StbE